MAKFASITPQALTEFNKFTAAADFSGIATAVASNGADTAKYGAVVAADGPDCKYLILVQNTNATSNAAAQKATIKAGNAIQGNHDVEVSLANGKYSIITVESGRFKNVNDNAELTELTSATAADRIPTKGKIVILGDSTYIKVAVFKLP